MDGSCRGCQDKTIGVCVSSSSFDRHRIGRLNQRTDQKLGDEPLRRRRLQDLECSNLTLVVTLMRCLMDLGRHENAVVDKFEGALFNRAIGLACKFSYHGFFLTFSRDQFGLYTDPER